MDGKWPVHVYPIWKELMLTWINRAWNGIPQDLTEKSFKSCGIANALDGSEDDAVWEDEEEGTKVQRRLLTTNSRPAVKAKKENKTYLQQY